MATLPESTINKLLEPYLSPETALPSTLYPKLSLYLDLLLKWNARTNLTAIREPDEIVRRHFGESLFAAQHLGPCSTLLDFGSGAGFPGIPIALLHPDTHVTLAESQNKKASFLREAARTLNISAEVWSARAETMPAERQFDVVTLRAVDNMDAAIIAAAPRARNTLLLLTTSSAPTPKVVGFAPRAPVQMPQSAAQHLLVLQRTQ